MLLTNFPVVVNCILKYLRLNFHNSKVTFLFSFKRLISSWFRNYRGEQLSTLQKKKTPKSGPPQIISILLIMTKIGLHHYLHTKKTALQLYMLIPVSMQITLL